MSYPDDSSCRVNNRLHGLERKISMADKDQAIHFCIGVLGGISSNLRGQSSDKCRKISETIDLGIEGIRELVDFYDSTKENPCEGCTNRKGCVTCENGELKETMQTTPPIKEFIYGIKWMEQQMMKDSVEYEYQVEEGGMSPFTVDGSIPVLTNTDMILLPKDKFKVGDKVKLIIVKK